MMLSTQATTIVVLEPIFASINFILHGVGAPLFIQETLHSLMTIS